MPQSIIDFVKKEKEEDPQEIIQKPSIVEFFNKEQTSKRDLIRKPDDKLPFPKTPGMKIIDFVGKSLGLDKLVSGAVGGFYGGAGQTFGAMANVVDFLSEKTGISKSDLFRKLSEQYGIAQQELEKRGLPGVAGKVASGMGQAGFVIPTIMALGPQGLPVHGGLMGTAEALPGGVEEALKGGLIGTVTGKLTHKILGGIGLLPSKARIPAYVGLGAATTPGDIEDRTVGALTWAVLGLGGGNKKLTVREFLENYPRIKGKIDNRIASIAIKKISPEVTQAEIEESGGARAVFDEVANTLQETSLETQIKPQRAVRDKGIKPVSEAEIAEFQKRGGKVEKLRVSTAAESLEREKLVFKKKQAKQEEKLTTQEIWSGIAPSPEAKTTVSRVARKIGGILQVEPQFKRLGADDTGLAFKTINAKRNMGMEKAEIFNKDLSKTKISNKEFIDLGFQAAKKAKAPEIPSQYRRAYGKIRRFFSDYEVRLKKAGVIDIGFVEGAKRDLLREKEQLNVSIKSKETTPTRKKEIREIIKDINKDISVLNKAQYVHIPPTWLEGLFSAENIGKKNVVTEFFAKRKTYDFEALGRFLLERGHITEKELDIRHVIGAYAHKAEYKIAMAEVFKAAKKDKLLKIEKAAPPGWQFLPKEKFPTLAGYKAHPTLAGYFERNFTRQGVVPEAIGEVLGMNISKILGPIKMAQFANPIILPMYDMIQAWWTGSYRSKNTPKNILKTFKAMKEKNQDYWDSHYWGAYSTPFTPGFKSYIKRIDQMVKKDPFLKEVAKKFVVGKLYEMSWNAAWTGDNYVRMLSFQHYKSKGYTSREAAQFTAKAHGDYASIPPATRRHLNKWFFTPSFKIAMMSAQAEMIKDAAKVISKPGQAQPKEKEMAKMFIGLASGILIRNVIMDKLGFKQDKWGLKYSKLVPTEKGMKEVVVHTASPDNVVLRLLHRFNMKEIIQDPESLNTFLAKAKWEAHPLWQWAYEVTSNKNVKFDPIYNKFDPPEKIMKDIGIYTVKRLVRMTEAVSGIDTKEKKFAAQRAFIKDSGNAARVISLFTLQYLRNPAQQRAQYKIQRLKSFFKQTQREGPPRTREQADKRLARYKKQLLDILKEFQ